MTTSQLAQNLSQLSDSLKATNNLINRLATLSFQPGAEPLDNDGGVRSELSQDIRDSLRQLEEDLELVKHETDDLNSGNSTSTRRAGTDAERERIRLEAYAARLAEDVRTSRSAFRRAQLRAKRASDAAKQKERELVYTALQHPTTSISDSNSSDTNAGDGSRSTNDLFSGRRLLAQKSKLNKEELEVDASANVTEALRRTHDLLSTELSRSRFAQETFDESQAALNELGDRYSNLDTILTRSRALLGTLLRSQKSDTWYLETAFYILLATLCWLVFRRLLLGPFVRLPLFFWNVFVVLLNWVVWQPLYFFLTLSGVLKTSTGSVDLPTKSRKPLIVQPSASGRLPTMAGQPSRVAVPAGAGGAGAKQGQALGGQESERIAQMAQDSERAAREGNQGAEPVVRGDGTVLKERDIVENPPNPKKKAFDAEMEDPKDGGEMLGKKDEL